MGCGASAGHGGGGGRGSKYKEAHPSEEAPDAQGEEMGKKKSSGNSKWHARNCTDSDLKMVRTINEAYPFKAEDQKVFKKEEKVWNPLDDGRHYDWGDVKVSKMQKAVHCVHCSVYILDRYNEVPFYFCMRCKREEKHLEMCVSCYNNGVLATGPRAVMEVADTKPDRDSFGGGMIKGRKIEHQEQNGYARMSEAASMRGSQIVRSKSQSLGVPNSSPPGSKTNSPRPMGGGPPPRKSFKAGGGDPHPTIPSGAYRGKISEAGSSRAAAFKLTFNSTGNIGGSGPDSCTVKGQCTGGTVMSWTETHPWGTIQFNGTLTVDASQKTHIKGKFKSSDGGGGTLDVVSG